MVIYEYEARSQGEEIIRSLKLACLLEGDVLKNKSKMHDVIRDMALWVIMRLCGREDKSFVVACVKLIEAHETAKWKDA